MSTIDSKPAESASQKAVDSKTPSDGPHNEKIRKAVVAKPNTAQENENAFIISMSPQPKNEEDSAVKLKTTYTAAEVRAKAKSFRCAARIQKLFRDIFAHLQICRREKVFRR